MALSLPKSESELLLLHSPRCSKSRAALALLEQRGVEVALRRYLEEPLSRAELAELRTRLGRPVREWTRRGEDAFREAGIPDDASDDAFLDLMAQHPVLMERPILVRGRRAAVGRPPEAILRLLAEEA